VCERIFRNFKFELPSTTVKRLVVTRVLVEHPVVDLEQLLKDQRRQESGMLRSVVREFAGRFRESHGMTLNFTDEAVDYLIAQALDQNLQVRDVCAAKFKDFQFGLKLIATNTGQTEFTIDKATAEAPDQVLSAWVVASYREHPPVPPAPPA
jgi:hypothetical protein